MKYRLVLLDVRGNEEDGFEVNDVTKTETYIDIKEDATDDEIKSALKDAEIMEPNGIEVKDSWFPDIFIDDEKTGKPLIKLEAAEENE